MVTHGTSGVPSRPGFRLDKNAERLMRLKIAAHNANAYQRRVASKGACGGAQPVARPRGPPVIGGVPTGVSRPPVNGGAPAAASATWSGEISVLHNGLIAVQMQLREMLGVTNRLVHERTAATAAAARPSAAFEACRGIDRRGTRGAGSRRRGSMGAVEATSAYADGCSGSITTTRSVTKHLHH